MEREALRARLRGKLFLSSMLNLTDGAYGVSHGSGAGLVQLGTMIVAPVNAEYARWRERWPKAFLPPEAPAMRRMLATEIAAVRDGLGDVVICLSIAGFDISHVEMAAQAFHDVGGDFVELNAHGGLEPWSEQGYLVGMSLPRYRQRLLQWVERLTALPIPLVIKFNTHVRVDFAQVCRDLADFPVFGYHFNVRDETTHEPDDDFVKAIRPVVEGVLLCSGYAWTAAAVQRLFALGVDCVGFARPVMDDGEFIANLAKELA